MSVDLAKGTWFDHENDTGGGVIDLIRRDNPLANINDVLEGLGIETDKPQRNGHDTIKTSLVATYPMSMRTAKLHMRCYGSSLRPSGRACSQWQNDLGPG